MHEDELVVSAQNLGQTIGPGLDNGAPFGLMHLWRDVPLLQKSDRWGGHRWIQQGKCDGGSQAWSPGPGLSGSALPGQPRPAQAVEGGAPLNKYDRPTFYSQGNQGYLDYPFMDGVPDSAAKFLT